LKLGVDGEPVAADEDEPVPRYRLQARAILGKKIPRFSLILFLELHRSNLSYILYRLLEINHRSRANLVPIKSNMWTPSSESSSDSDEIMTSGSEKTDGAEAEEESEVDEFQFDSDAERQSTADDDGDIVVAEASGAPPTFRAPEIILLSYPG
jgi:hypothetical protein